MRAVGWTKSARTCTDPVVSFIPGLALMKTTVLKSMRTLSYFRLDTLDKFTKVYDLSQTFTLGGS